jgi:hypothetical protein
MRPGRQSALHSSRPLPHAAVTERGASAMPRILSTVLVFSLSGLASFAQQPNEQRSKASEQSSWVESWREATISLGQIVNEGGVQTYAAGGSGFVVGVAGGKGGIITAKHVVSEPDKGWHPSELRMRFSWEEHKSITEELGFTLPLLDRNGRDLWTSAADGSDVVFIPLSNVAEIPAAHRALVGIFPSQFGTDADLYEGAPVFILGFPVMMGLKYLVRPIVRSGVIAWTDPDDPAHRPFLVDSNLYPGNSGGPVLLVPNGLSRSGGFVVSNSGLALIGIVSQGPVQNAEVTAAGRPLPPYIDPVTHQPAKLTAQVTSVGGIGLIVPVSEIRKLLDQVFGPGASTSSPPQK